MSLSFRVIFPRDFLVLAKISSLGYIPRTLGDLTALKELSLSKNKLSGRRGIELGISYSLLAEDGGIPYRGAHE